MHCSFIRSCAVAITGLLICTSAQAQTKGNRALFVEEIRNEQAPFMVRVAVDKPNCVYEVGDTLTASVVSEEAGYLYLFYIQANNQVAVVFPNNHQKENRIPARQVITIPASDAKFRLRVGEPVGQEILKAVVSKTPLKSLSLTELQKSAVTSVDGSAMKAMYVDELKPATRTWAEHDVEITTVKKGDDKPPSRRRFAVCVGISDFAQVNDLKCSHRDGEKMAELLRSKCGFQDVVLLTNQQATKANIENSIRALAEKSKAGDDIVIFWSGHGSRVADDNGDEKDGYDEALVPYDADPSNVDTIRKTFILDDAFGRWIQALDGRKVLVVLDTCHSGGQATNAKGLDSMRGVKAPVGGFDFFDKELGRMKDLGQVDTGLLASSTPQQVSFERSEGDLSVMTFYLIEDVQKSAGKAPLLDIYKQLSDQVPAYVTQSFPGAMQTPILVHDFKAPFNLKP